jgi:hypothetical protein
VKRILAFAAVVAATLAFASAALASSLTAGHGPQAGPGPTSTSGPAALPFTGLDLAGGVAVAGVLLGCGLVLRRVGRRQQS